MDELNQVLNFSEEMQAPDFLKSVSKPAGPSLRQPAGRGSAGLGKRDRAVLWRRLLPALAIVAAAQTCHPAVTSVLTPLPLTAALCYGKNEGKTGFFWSG